MPFVYCQWPDEEIWTRDIDWKLPAILMNALHVQLGVPLAATARATLEQYADTLFSDLDNSRKRHWILPLGIRHRLHQAHGLQFCPACLANEDTRYFRVEWRLALVSTCQQHGLVLHDRCWKCGSGLNPHRLPQGASISQCYCCGAELSLSEQRLASAPALAFQRHNIGILERGYASLGRHVNLYSPAYFRIVRQICRLLLSGGSSELLWHEIDRLRGRIHSPLDSAEHIAVEEATSEQRHQLFEVAHLALQEWPDRFIRLCRQSDVLSSDVLRDIEPPFALAEPVWRCLSGKSYTITATEIASAQAAAPGLRVSRSKRDTRRRISTASQMRAKLE